MIVAAFGARHLGLIRPHGFGDLDLGPPHQLTHRDEVHLENLLLDLGFDLCQTVFEDPLALQVLPFVNRHDDPFDCSR
jgi:hypothetical protein